MMLRSTVDDSPVQSRRAEGQGRLLAYTSGATMAIFGIGVASTFGAIDPDWMIAQSQVKLQPVAWSTIMLRNSFAACFVFSGCATAGVTTVVGLLLLGMYMGATVSVAASGGYVALISEVGLYLPLELGALLLAACGGLLPIAGTLTTSSRHRSTTLLQRYLDPLASSTRIMLLSLLLLAVAAWIESAVIHSNL